MVPSEDIERLLSLVVYAGDGVCWPWVGMKDRDGYGLFNGRPKVWRAHRVVFVIANGYLPPVVRHSCDNPNCCNPNHLLGGTQADNVRDMIERGRVNTGNRARGARHHRTKAFQMRRRRIAA